MPPVETKSYSPKPPKVSRRPLIEITNTVNGEKAYLKAEGPDPFWQQPGERKERQKYDEQIENTISSERGRQRLKGYLGEDNNFVEGTKRVSRGRRGRKIAATTAVLGSLMALQSLVSPYTQNKNPIDAAPHTQTIDTKASYSALKIGESNLKADTAYPNHVNKPKSEAEKEIFSAYTPAQKEKIMPHVTQAMDHLKRIGAPRALGRIFNLTPLIKKALDDPRYHIPETDKPKLKLAMESIALIETQADAGQYKGVILEDGERPEGLLQLTDKTARSVPRLADKPAAELNLYDDEISLRVGAQLYEHYLEVYGGNLELLFAAQNLGPGVVNQFILDLARKSDPNADIKFAQMGKNGGEVATAYYANQLNITLNDLINDRQNLIKKFPYLRQSDFDDIFRYLAASELISQAPQSEKN